MSDGPHDWIKEVWGTPEKRRQAFAEVDKLSRILAALKNRKTFRIIKGGNDGKTSQISTTAVGG